MEELNMTDLFLSSPLNRKEPSQKEDRIAAIVVDACIKLHTALGPGLLESVYEIVLARVLEQKGCCVVRQAPIPIVFNGMTFEEGFRADLLVNNLLIIGLKSV